MRADFLSILVCPRTGQALKCDGDELVAVDNSTRYPVRNGIPRFVTESNYADNFGMQWNHFRQTQLDSQTGHSISADRFWKATGWTPDAIKNQWVLDVGCGAGRFAEVALNAGAKVVALDYSSAVNACYANLKHHPNLHVVQGDVYALPFAPCTFPFVYSLGVLQHTPDVEQAFVALTRMLRPNGRICVDYYWRRFQTMMHAKYAVRPITTRMQPERVFKLLQQWTPALLKASQTLGRIPVAGRYLQRIIPVADYTNSLPLSPQQLREWALLDTFDMLTPTYDNPQTPRQIRKWCVNAGIGSVEVLHATALVARGVMH